MDDDEPTETTQRCSCMRNRWTRTALCLQILAVILLFGGVVLLSVTLGSRKPANQNEPALTTTISAAKAEEASSGQSTERTQVPSPSVAPLSVPPATTEPVTTAPPSALALDSSLPPEDDSPVAPPVPAPIIWVSVATGTEQRHTVLPPCDDP